MAWSDVELIQHQDQEAAHKKLLEFQQRELEFEDVKSRLANARTSMYAAVQPLLKRQ